MGEVYRARDTELKREVALKILPEEVSADPERLARLRREAQMLAALNHPNVAAIHTVGQAQLEGTGPVLFLDMELVEGMTLAQRLQGGPLSLQEALQVGRHVAEALEAAHERGIIHRDLKPANVMVTSNGGVKVLDFGLARPLQVGDTTDLTEAPTELERLTATGTFVGTVSYMSPEQVRGQALDKRTDIWAFGCLLYEALTARRAFDRETVADTLAAIIDQRPDWEPLPATTPVKARSLLRRCLRKDPDQRLHDIADARIEIDEALEPPPEELSGAAGATVAPAFWQRAVPWAVAGMSVVVLAALLVNPSLLSDATRPAPSATRRLSVMLPASAPISRGRVPEFAITPDGNSVVYEVDRAQGYRGLFVRSLDRDEASPLPGADGGGPFVSPDGRWIGFVTNDNKLEKVPFEGGRPLVICDLPGVLQGAAWKPDGTIVFATRGTGLWRVTADGGSPEQITRIDEDNGESNHYWPSLLPDGEHVLFTVGDRSGNYDRARIDVLSLSTGERKLVLQGGTYARYAAGHLLYARSGVLFAVAFDLRRQQTEGSPVPLLQDVHNFTPNGYAAYAIAQDGSIFYVPVRPANDDFELVWVDRDGSTEPVSTRLRGYGGPRISPDGERLATAIYQPKSDIWIYDIAQDAWQQLTSGSPDGQSYLPVWSPGGELLLFASNRSGPYNLFVIPADGSSAARQLTQRATYTFPLSWLRNGLVAVRQTTPGGFVVSVARFEQLPDLEPFLSSGGEFDASFSPDGRWIAYLSNKTGRFEIYVQAYPGPGRTWPISRQGGGTDPLWSHDGQEIFYLNGDRMMTVPVDTRRGFTAGPPRLLFELETETAGNLVYLREYDVFPDGQRFVMVRRTSPEPARTHFNLVLNWFEEVKQLIPTDR